MTDDTTLPEIPSQLRRTSSPGFMTGSPIKPTAAATRARESKIRKSIKTVTPVKTATSIYAQMLRWSFGATLLVSAILVGFIYLTWQAGNPPFYLFAILAGANWRLHEYADQALQLRGISAACGGQGAWPPAPF